MGVLNHRISKAESAWKSASGPFAGACLLFAAALIIDSLAGQISDISGSLASVLVSVAFIIPPIGITLIFVLLIFRSSNDRRITHIALAAVAVSLLCRVIWISVYSSYQISDFGYYLQCGAHVASTGSPNGSFFCDDVYWRRSAFYTCPLVYMFGQSLMAIKLANVLITTLTSWIFYQTGRIIFGARLAAIALAFFIWHPDLWYAMTLASHDIPGLFWLAIFFYLCALLQRRLLQLPTRWPALAGLSVCLGGTIFFLDYSRSYHYGAIPALALNCIVHISLLFLARANSTTMVSQFLERLAPAGIPTRARLKIALTHAIFLLLIPLGVYRLANLGFSSVWQMKPEQRDAGLICYASVIDVLGTTNYVEINNWYERECPNVVGPEKTALAARKVLHDVTHDPWQFLRHLERKNRILGFVDDYIEWSTFATYESFDTTHSQVKRINRQYLPEQHRAVAIVNAVVLGLVLWRLLLFPGLPFRLSELVPLAFSWMYYLMFLFLVEMQPRYDIFLVFPFSWMAAQALTDLQRRAIGHPGTQAASPLATRFRIYTGGALMLVALVGAYWGSALLIADSYLTLRDQSGFVQVPAEQIVSAARQYFSITPVFEKNNHKQLMPRYPTGATVEADSILAVQREFTIKEKGSHHLRFFISTYAVRAEPYDNQVSWEDADLIYLVAVNGKTIASGRLNDIPDNRYFSFYPKDGLEFSRTMKFQVIVRNTRRIARVEANRGPILSLEYLDLQ